MKNIVIVVEEGIVQSVYADFEDVDVEIVDFDTEDPDELEEAQDRLDEIEDDKSLTEIY